MQRAGIYCPDCNSSDALTLYTDQHPFHTYCFSCGTFTPHKNFKRKFGESFMSENNLSDFKPEEENFDFYEQDKESDSSPVVEHIEGPDWKTGTSDISFRGIKPSTFKKYDIKFQKNDSTGEVERHIYPYFDLSGNLVAQKVRADDKSFHTIIGKNTKAGFFGQQLFGMTGKWVLLTEGELDTASAYQMLGGKVPCVSTRNGASGCINDLKTGFKFLNSFSEIRVCFDPDKAGREAVAKFVKKFDKRKVKIIRLDPSIGDINDYLVKGKQKEFINAYWEAEPYRPEQIVSAKSLKTKILEKPPVKSIPYPWKSINDLTYGMRLGELDTWIASTGSGKSSFVREIVHHLLNVTDDKIGMIMLEESMERTVEALMSLDLNRPIYLPDYNIPKSEWEDSFDRVFKDDRVFLYSDSGSTNMDNIFEAVEFLNVEEGCKFIFLDHISMITSDQRYSDERVALDEIVNKLNQYTVSHNLHITQVAHINRQGQIRGTAGIEQVSHKIVRLIRDKTNEDDRLKNITKLVVEKNRFSGRTGSAGFIEFNPYTSRLHEVNDVDDEMLGIKE